MLYLLTLLPVVLFIIVLYWLDTFSLVKRRYLILAFSWGIIATLLSGRVNGWFGYFFPIPLLVAPIVEEALKGLVVLFIIQRKKSAFFIDTAIYGAAAGAGFAFMENILYVQWIPDMLMGTAIARGFGTAIMHCGAVATSAILLYWISRYTTYIFLFYPLALLPAVGLHAVYNALIMPPAVSLGVILFGVTGMLILLFFYNEQRIGKWMELEMNGEVKLLLAMQRGEFTQTKAGAYLLAVKEQFTPECYLDMYWYVRLYLELSLIAKRNMMLSEAGIEIPTGEATSEKVTEFYTLRKAIGITAVATLSPLVNLGAKERWKINSLR